MLSLTAFVPYGDRHFQRAAETEVLYYGREVRCCQRGGDDLLCKTKVKTMR